MKQVVKIGQFLVNLKIVTIDSLKSMRSFWPKRDYTLVKNRKTARIARQNNKKNRIENKGLIAVKNKVGRPRV